jgi:SpoVK/Ycf46/Vps4 family AAA+-type ATPase
MAPGFSIAALAEATDGLSGSDLRELCRNAAMVPVREFMQSTSDNHEALVKGQLEVFLLFLFTLIWNSRESGIRFATSNVGGFLRRGRLESSTTYDEGGKP